MTPIAMLARLVSFNSVSHESNLPLMQWVASYLAEHGVAARLITDADGRKANLIASIGPAMPGGIVLSGHSDVVPVDGQPWSSDPFVMERRGDRLFGRGTADMKAFSAVFLALVPEFQARALAVPVHFAFSYDEEVGCHGVHSMLPVFADPTIRPAAVIVGEPTMMKVCTAHKAVHGFTTTVTGLEAHSSRTHAGVNAVMYAAEIIGFLAALGAEQRAGAKPDSGFDPPYSTVHVGTIAGGTAHNIIPRHCAFNWEIRALPGVDGAALRERVDAFVATQLLPRMHAVSPATGVETAVRAYVPALLPEPGSSAETLALRWAAANHTEVVAYGSEAGLFQQTGIPTVLCGPGDIAQAHQPDEFIEVAQLDACVAFMRRLMDWAERPV